MYVESSTSMIQRVTGNPFDGAGIGCGSCGLGGLSMDGSGLFGSGVFGTGVSVTDVSTWSVGEYAALGLSLFVLYSLFATTKRGVEGTRKRARRISAAVRAAA